MTDNDRQRVEEKPNSHRPVGIERQDRLPVGIEPWQVLSKKGNRQFGLNFYDLVPTQPHGDRTFALYDILEIAGKQTGTPLQSGVSELNSSSDLQARVAAHRLHFQQPHNSIFIRTKSVFGLYSSKGSYRRR